MAVLGDRLSKFNQQRRLSFFFAHAQLLHTLHSSRRTWWAAVLRHGGHRSLCGRSDRRFFARGTPDEADRSEGANQSELEDSELRIAPQFNISGKHVPAFYHYRYSVESRIAISRFFRAP